ncbi:flavodoxin domain-containing protein [Streptomyces sp. B93]|uniref:flavodoxin domain-containing protein n=1 Tax=Streptomyces sp. B93 TaxID=2824875 RepID=UPI001B395201|nr:flavodoxin domain-containing protein [Streptomyces sp. B93]MBQ1089906.1 flavodoxin [Streptomyces sp. B93]
MDGKVLIAYGTTNGSTARIAETVAEVLNREGVPAEALPARSVPDAAAYEAVVVGGALYAGRWHKDARRFVRRHRGELAGRPVWFFSSGPLDASASEREIPPVPGVQRAMTGLDAMGHTTFGGRLEEGAHGTVARMILRSGKGGDYRDFTAVVSWATEIAKELTARERAT